MSLTRQLAQTTPILVLEHHEVQSSLRDYRIADDANAHLRALRVVSAIIRAKDALEHPCRACAGQGWVYGPDYGDLETEPERFACPLCAGGKDALEAAYASADAWQAKDRADRESAACDRAHDAAEDAR